MSHDAFALRETKQTASRFAARHLAPGAADRDHAAPGFPEAVFAQGVRAGFDRFLLPEEAGGFGFDLSALCGVMEVLAQACAGHAMVFGVHAACVGALHHAGCDKTRLEELLET